MSNAILSCRGLGKTYHDGVEAVEVLGAVDFCVQPGETLAIVGPSGSGKSTLLHLLGGLDTPSRGEVRLQGVDWQGISEKRRCELRNRHLGFVYQFHHLLPEFSALENVAMPLLLAGRSPREACALAEGMLAEVGLSARITHRPSQLSGGERQRVAIARALVHTPQCVLADEPTGNLDNTTAARIFDLLLALNEKFQTALVIVTHDLQLAGRMKRTVRIQEGALLAS